MKKKKSERKALKREREGERGKQSLEKRQTKFILFFLFFFFSKYEIEIRRRENLLLSRLIDSCKKNRRKMINSRRNTCVRIHHDDES